MHIHKNRRPKNTIHDSTNVQVRVLKKALKDSQLEAQKLNEKFFCLISLIKRSWKGDKGASIHIANIIGADQLQASHDGHSYGAYVRRVEKQSHSGASNELCVKTGVGVAECVGNTGKLHAKNVEDKSAQTVKNWERIVLQLRNMVHAALQDKVKEDQLLYLEQRSQYMDQILLDHRNDMGHSSPSHPSLFKHHFYNQPSICCKHASSYTSSNSPGFPYSASLLSDIDQLFIQKYSKSNRLVPSRHSAPTKHHLSCASSDPNEHHQRPKSANIFIGPAFGLGNLRARTALCCKYTQRHNVCASRSI